MKTQRMKWMVGAIALFGFLAISGASHASCTGDDRLELDEARCLTGTHNNICVDKLFGHCLNWQSTYSARKLCRDVDDKTVAKIDLAHSSDKTWHLNDYLWRDGESMAMVRGIYCCDDLGTCN